MLHKRVVCIFAILALISCVAVSSAIAQKESVQSPTEQNISGSEATEEKKEEEQEGQKEEQKETKEQTGQVSSFTTFHLGELIVESERGAALSSMNQYSSVTAKQIEASGSKNVTEALRYVPTINMGTGRKNDASVRITGFAANQSLFLIDGVPYYETYEGQLNLKQIPTEMIARIDVIRGAPSVLYGPNSLGGVVNIITKNASEGPTFSATAQVADYGGYDVSAQHGNTIADKFKYWLSIRRFYESGWNMSSRYKVRYGEHGPNNARRLDILEDGGRRKNSGEETTSLWGKVGFDPGTDTSIYVSGYYIYSKFKDPWNVNGYPAGQSNPNNLPVFTAFDQIPKYQDWGIDFDATTKLFDALTIKAKFFYHKHEDDYYSFAFPPAGKLSTSTYSDYNYGGQILLDWQMFSFNNLRFAYHYRFDLHGDRADDYLPFDRSTSDIQSIAFENELRPFEGLTIVGGISYDWMNVLTSTTSETNRDGTLNMQRRIKTPGRKDAVNPMGAISYEFPDKTKLFFSIAGKTHFPTLRNFTSGDGNLNLKAERATNVTGGISRPFGDWLQLGLTGFYSNISNYITADYPGRGRTYYNMGRVVSQGFEVSATITPIEDLTLNLGYVYNDAKNRSDERATTKVTYMPDHKLTANLEYTIPKIKTRINAGMILQGREYTQVPSNSNPTNPLQRTIGHVVFDLRLTQPIIEDHVEAFVQFKNLFDNNYETNYGYPARGFSAWGGVKVTF